MNTTYYDSQGNVTTRKTKLKKVGCRRCSVYYSGDTILAYQIDDLIRLRVNDLSNSVFSRHYNTIPYRILADVRIPRTSQVFWDAMHTEGIIKLFGYRGSNIDPYQSSPQETRNDA